jgi:tetratricopeptide (TPR) repeat protein
MGIAPGTPLGPYTVRAQLGSGGMGEVYRAHDPRLGRDIAVKLIRAAAVDRDDALDRLLREATLASALNHPNIVTIYETGVAGRDRYVAMELVEGATLRRIASDGVTVDRAVELVRQVAEALAVAHAAQIVHRDIKPENVMVRPDGYVKVLDFGLARLQPDPVAAGATNSITEAGSVLGTIGYMAPEQARGQKAGDAADVFATGIMLYELVTGRHPFTAASPLATLHALISETPPPPSAHNPELPRSLDQLIIEALQKDPRLRPTALELMARLNAVREPLLAFATAPVPSLRGTGARTIVGRDQEMDVLLQEFERAERGRGRLVAIAGEAGMGKTTLVEAFFRDLDERGAIVRVGRGRCSERLAGSEAYLPVMEALDSLQRHESLGGLSRLFRTLAPSWYAQIMPAPENESSAERLAAATAGGSQERLKLEMAALLDEITRLHPVVLCFDDVHWADASTIDLIGYLARRIENRRLLVVTTYRPSELAQARHPFVSLKLDLMAHNLCREIAPGFLDETAIDRYVRLQFPDHTFPAELSALIHRRTEGNPLFVADLLRDLRRRQIIKQENGQWILTAPLPAVEAELPPSVRSLIQRKMEALDEEDRRLLGAAGVQGIDFDTAIVARALGQDQSRVEDRLERLEREHAVVRFVDEWEHPDRTLTLRYRFVHHVYHNAFYDALRVTRRAALSRSVADALIATADKTERHDKDARERTTQIALLLETARDNLRAAEYFNLAAQSAARLYANEETERLALRGLALLESEPPSEARVCAELDLQMTYGLSVKTSRGYAVPEVGRAYARARTLCREIHNPARSIPILIGLSAHHIVSGDIAIAHDIALEMLALFETMGDRHLKMIGEWSLGAAKFHLGEIEQGHAHLRRGLDLYEPAFHNPRVWETGIDPGIFCRCEVSRTFLLLGYPDGGLAAAHEAVAQARALEHAQTLAFALLFEMFAHLARREPRELLETFEELEMLCRARGIAQELQWALPLRGRALVELGEIDRGLRQMAEGLEAQAFTRSGLLRPYYYTLHAGAMLRARRYADAQRALAVAKWMAAQTSQHAYDAEHSRILGELHAAQGRDADADASFRDAIEVAERQAALWLALRSARAYASFLAARNQPGEAHAVLAPVVARLTEGHETRDAVAARALLDTLT